MNDDQIRELLGGGPSGIARWNELQSPVDNPSRVDCIGLLKLENMQLSGANFSDMALAKSSFAGSNMESAQFLRSIVTDFGFEGADLRDASFQGAYIIRARLDRADFRVRDWHVITSTHESPKLLRSISYKMWVSYWLLKVLPVYQVPFVLDDCDIQGTRFNSNSSDPWSVLKRNYTGSSMAFILLFTLAAFLPVISKAALLSTTSRIQEVMCPAIVSRMSDIAELLASDSEAKGDEWAAEVFSLQENVSDGKVAPETVRRSLPLLAKAPDAIEAIRARTDLTAAKLRQLEEMDDWVQQALETVRLLSSGDELSLEARSVLSLIIGAERTLLYASLSIVLLVYGAARMFLTNRVGPLRDEESRCHVTPRVEQYWHLWRIHQVISPILAISVIFGGYRIVSFLLSDVLVPA